MPNINNASTAWLDLYGLSGIAAGTPVNIQNQGSPLLQIRDNLVDPIGRIVPTYGNQDCWGSPVLQVRSSGGISIFVQEVPA